MMSEQVKQAYERANRFLLHQLTSRFSQDSTVDLTDILTQQTKSYPELRRSLAERALTQAGDGRAIAPAVQSPSYSTKSNLEACGAVRVVHPLQPRLAHFFKLPTRTGERPLPTQDLSKESIAALNQAIRNGTSLSSLGSSHVLNLGSSIAVKIGQSLNLDQIKILQWIKSQDNQFLVPDVLGAFKTARQTYLFMSLAKGVPLEEVWRDLAVSQKKSIRCQLSRIFVQLRRFPRPPNSLLGGMSSRCTDVRRTERTASFPISNEAKFNDFLCSDSQRTRSPLIKLVRTFMRDNHQIVMTHGDLHPRNIMITWDGCVPSSAQSQVPNAETLVRITSLLDWEFGGWYPECWEFIKALNTIGHRDPMSDWAEYLPPSIGQWVVEFAIDSQISRWLGT